MVTIMSRHTFKLQMTSQITAMKASLTALAGGTGLGATADEIAALKTFLDEFHAKQERFTDADLVELFNKINAYLTALDALV